MFSSLKRVLPAQTVGIDFGTSCSSVARLLNNGEIRPIKDPYSESEWIPSIVYFSPTGEVLIGEAALDEQREHPTDVIYDSKRMIGRNYNNEHIQKLKNEWPFEICEDKRPETRGKILIKTQAGLKEPWEICKEIIKYLLYIAQDQAGNTQITHAVLSVPANYDTTQRNDIMKAAVSAGLKVVNFITEPTAGVLNYWYYNNNINIYNDHEQGYVLIYDFGGGTLDISLAHIKNNNIEIIAVDGDMFLGGRDIDRNLTNYYLEQKNLKDYMSKYFKYDDSGCSLEIKNERKLARNNMRCIQNSCKKIKEKLSGLIKQAYINPDFQMLDDGRLHITVEKFKELNKDLFSKLLPPVERILSGKGINKSNIKDIILIGGSSSIPFVKEALYNFFLRQPYKDGEPRNAVVTGAAIDARRRYVDNKDCCKELLNLKYTDVCPLSIGTDIIGNRVSFLIKKNEKLPCKYSQIYYSCSNFQKTMTFNIYETEKPIVSNDCLIGSLSVRLPELQAGEAKVELTLSIDENGILTASAKVIGHLISEKKIIRGGGCLNESFILSKILSADRTRSIDIEKAQKQYLNARWENLHQNVLSFIEKYKDSVIKDKENVFRSFNEIKAIANREKNHDVLSETYFNGMVEEYKKRFEVYNRFAPPDRKTIFLNNA
ncbi:ATPase with role in protein import into the ER [Tritrichomonas musculus]|uniref:ATPase with role in protein import into the ER n=1 Tax=Tritrichomonas musculus TaxID=1915356 RepID=A0ABR2H9W4_9EUKA